MVKNVRWLYNKLGTTDFSAAGGGSVTDALSSIQSNLSGKAESSHTHGVGDLPVTSSLSTNSTSYVPTSSAVYSLKSTMDILSNEIQSMQDQMNPNNRYESKSLGTWSSTSDVDTFLSRFNHDNLYKDGDTELAVGNYVSIRDGADNLVWIIAGFDMEHNQIAADGTVYDNGYGICLVPHLVGCYTAKWNKSNNLTGGYISSYVHSYLNSTCSSRLKNVIGGHFVTRDVLLSNNIDSSNHSNGYQWTTADLTLPSIGQVTGTFASHNNQYDDGEANYKLPLFDHAPFSYTGRTYTTRCIYGYGTNGYSCWSINGDVGNIRDATVTTSCYIRPLIYIR